LEKFVADPPATISGVLLTTAIGAVVGGVGWIVAYILAGRRDDRTKRLQLQIEHSSIQSKEFYAPLVALTQQLDSTVTVLEAVTNGKVDAEYDDLAGLMHVRFFLPLHEQINEILKTKVHLLEGSVMPASFAKYFEHFTTEKAFWSLKNDGKDVSQIKIPPFPSQFYEDVRVGYAVVLKQYDDALKELRAKRSSL
jgi:hypothetical protein